MTLPDPMTIEFLLDFADGRLDDELRNDVERWLADHPKEARRLANYLTVAKTRREDESQPCPADIVERAKQIFDVAQLPAGSEQSILGGLMETAARLAQLVFDSRVQVAGTRHSALSERFQLSFELDGILIDLEIEPAGRTGDTDRFRIMGQIDAESPVAAPVVQVLDAHGATVQSATADEHGHFSCECAPGVYVLQVDVQGNTVQTSRFEVP